METVLHAAAIWFIIGFILFLLEFAVPGLILLFFGIGAWLVAILLLFVDLSLNLQLIIFLITSIITVLLFRKWVKKIIWTRKHSTELVDVDDEFIGKLGKAETAISPGQNGKVNFKGSAWDARSEEFIEPGESVVIIGNESILLIVKSTKTA